MKVLSIRYICCLLALLNLFSCHPKAVRKPDTPQTASGSQIIEITDPALESLVVAFLSKDADSSSAVSREVVEAELIRYLKKHGQSEATFKMTRNGFSFLFPVRLIEEPPEHQPMAGWQNIGPEIHAPVLDMVWQPSNSQLLILLADSLLVWHMEKVDYVSATTVKFPQKSLRQVRSAYPTGILSFLRAVDDDQIQFAVLTSNLQDIVSGSPADSVLRMVSSAVSALDPDRLQAWHIPLGKSLYYDRQGRAGAVRSFRDTPDQNAKVWLDENGRLVLYDKQLREEIWSSETPWGNRIFILGRDRIAVCNTWSDHFYTFLIHRDRLELQAKSPSFVGRVTAVAAVGSADNKGLLVCAQDTIKNNKDINNRVFFMPAQEIQWRRMDRNPVVEFPDFSSELRVRIAHAIGYAERYHDLPKIIHQSIFETLMTIRTDGEVVPLIAERMTGDTSGRRWQIKIRKNLFYSDGTPLTATDIVKGWHYAWRICNRSGCDGARLTGSIQGVDDFYGLNSDQISGITILDEYALEIVLKTAIPRFKEYLAHPCFAVRKTADRNQRGIGSGPFYLERTSKDLFVLFRNDLYHGGMPPAKALQVHFVNASIDRASQPGSSSAMVLRNKSNIRYLQQLGNNRTVPFPNPAIYYLAMNATAIGLSDPGFRRFVADSIVDRRELTTIMSDVDCEAVFSFFSSQNSTGDLPLVDSLMLPEDRIHIMFREQDPVARLIAERLVARLSQASIPASTLPLTDLAFEKRQMEKQYDMLVDEYDTTHFSPVLNFSRLFRIYQSTADTGYWTAKHEPQGLISSDVDGLEKEARGRGLLVPILSVRNYVVLPESYRSVILHDTGIIDASKAWIARTIEME